MDRTKACYIARSPKVAARELDGEMMIMSAADSTLFVLDDVATAIWKAADGVTPLNEVIARQLCEGYNIAPEVAAPDVETFVEELAGRGLLLISDEPILDSSQKTSAAP
jgi:hypothetical protein